MDFNSASNWADAFNFLLVKKHDFIILIWHRGFFTMNLKNCCAFTVSMAFLLAAHMVMGQTITVFSPTFGKAGSYVTINGDGFIAGSTKVYFNGIKATATVTSTTEIQAVVPSSMTPGPIGVQNGSGVIIYSQVNFTNITSAPFISSFSPSFGAGGTPVTFSGANFTGLTSVKFAGVTASFSTPAVDDEFSAVTPKNVLTGSITVTSAKGSYTTSNYFYGVPIITGFSPKSEHSGAQITISGTNFLGTTKVTVSGVSTEFTVNSNNKITATVPDGISPGVVSITTPAMSTATTSNFYLLPTISGFSPVSGSAGTVVTITGINLKVGTTNPVVKFNGVAATVSSSTTDQIIVSAPSGGTTGYITVSTGAGSDTISNYFYYPPTVSSLNPWRGQPGTAVTITGQNFIGTTALYFTGISTPFTVVNNTTITTTVPVTKSGYLTVTTPGGSVTNGTFFIPPVIFSFTPTSGMTNSTVVISGSFPDTPTNVFFNGTNASFTVNGTNSISAIVPTNATTGPISVVAAGGTNTTTASFQVLVEVTPPTITGFSPQFGGIGTVVTLTGTDLDQGSVLVYFNGTNATPTTITATNLTVTVPDGALSGPIKVVTKNGTAVTTNNFLLPPVITDFSPTNGIAGSTVTLTGTNFTNAASIDFNGVSASFTVDDNNQITAIVPSLASSGPVRITNLAGTNSSSDSFFVPPQLTGFSPSTGLALSTVSISGSFPDGATSVLFNDIPATIVSTTPSLITVIVPSDAETGPITIVAKGGTVTSTDSFTVVTLVQLPRIASFSPSSGPVGSQVIIAGSNLNATPVTVTINTTAALVTSIAANRIAVIVPSGTISGPITVTTKNGTFTTTSNFFVTATIASFSPETGLPGSAVIINGMNFTDTTAVTFNGADASFRILSDSQIIATVPANASSGSIAVTTSAGTRTSPTYFLVPPIITTFTPTNGYAGTTVSISGYFPDGVTNVLFNGTAGIIMLSSSSLLQAVVPTGATTGPVQVMALGGTDKTTDQFVVNATTLSISLASSNSINLTWTAPSNYVLQYLSDFGGTNLWLMDTNTPVETNGAKSITEPMDDLIRFFRIYPQ